MSYQIEIRHIKYFLAVAEELHFRKAAERLFISQPGLSRQIKQMEKDLGLTLFDRHNRKVKLTDVGLYLKEKLRENLKSLEKTLSEASMLSKGFDGSLKLGYVGSAMQKVIPNYMLQMKQKQPNVTFSLNELSNQNQIEGLVHQEIDVGFVRLERVPKGLKLMPIFEDTFSVVLPKNHPIDDTNFTNLSQFSDESFISFDASYSQSYYDKVMQIFDYYRFTPNISHYTINASSIFRMVENGFGISIVPTSLKLGFAMDVKFIELSEIPQRTTLRVAWNTANNNPMLGRLLGVMGVD